MVKDRTVIDASEVLRIYMFEILKRLAVKSVRNSKSQEIKLSSKC